MNWIVKSILVFILTAFSEMLWVIWIRRTSQGKAFSAASLGATLWISSALVIVSYVENKWMLIPAFLGSFISGYLTVKFDVKKQSRLIGKISNNGNKV
jgi:hypothetical protein